MTLVLKDLAINALRKAPINTRESHFQGTGMLQNPLQLTLKRGTIKQPSRSTPTCAFCGASSNHRTDECRKFQALTIQERGEACMRRGMCFRCLHRGHLKKKCNSKIQCEKCKMYHHTLLHDPKMERRENTPEASKTDSPNAVPTVPTGSTNTKGTGNRNPAMIIVPVTVRCKNDHKEVTTYALH